MASMRKTTGKAGPRWQVRWRQDGKQVSETFATEKQAVMFRGLVDAAGQHFPEGWHPGAGFTEVADEEPGGLTLREWYPRAIASSPKAAPGTKKRYLTLIANHVPDELLDTPMDRITREQAGTWLAELLAVRSPKTAKNVHGVVSTCIKQAITDGHLNRNPFAGLVPRAERQVEPVFLEPAEFELLCSCVPAHWQGLVDWLYRSGMRWGEATALQWRDIDFGQGRVDVRRAWKKGESGFYLGPPKTKRSRRSIAMPPAYLGRVKAAYAGDPEGFVFLAPQGGRVWHHEFHQAIWLPTVTEAMTRGLTKRPRIHDLRHSHASLLLGRGVPLLAVSRRLGHSSVAVTGDVYGHLEVGSDDVILAALA